MTIQDLINQLSKYDPSMKIVFVFVNQNQTAVLAKEANVDFGIGKDHVIISGKQSAGYIKDQ